MGLLRDTFIGLTLALWLENGANPLATDLPVCPVRPDTASCSFDPNVIRLDRSLFVNDPSIIAMAGFDFAKTVGKILTSEGLDDTPANREALLRTLLDSFSESEQTNKASNLRMKLDVRRAQKQISAAEMLDPNTGMIPVAIFNRLDLAPEDWDNCGEYRIVYASRGSGPESLIFEAVVKNPHKELGGRGCKPLVDFWLSLSSRTDDEVAVDLERFFYQGLGSGFGSVVSASNYGIPDGQVRSNSKNIGQWQLREWKLSPLGESPISFNPVTTKMNPLAELYGDNSNGALDPPRQEIVRAEFHNAFLHQYVVELLTPDLCVAPVNASDLDALRKYEREILNTFGAKFDDKFNDFQSSVHYRDSPFNYPNNVGLGAEIDQKVSSLALGPDRRVTSEEVVNRAEALTCGGCHGLSNSKVIGRTNSELKIEFPPHREFQHVGGHGELSTALKETFLPFRKDKMIEFICNLPEKVDGMVPDERVAKATQDFSEILGELRRGEKRSDAVVRYMDLLQLLNSIEANKKGYFVQVRRPH
jgi:hypothetical protein